MKRGSDSDDQSLTNHNKKLKVEDSSSDEVGDERRRNEVGFNSLDENLLYEVLKHVDAKTLAMASCVSKTWSRTAADERLWELIYTRQWNNIGCSNQQLRSVVVPLGGFRRLHSLSIWAPPKSSSSTSSSSSASVSSSTAAAAAAAGAASPAWKVKPRVAAKWGKDEVHLSLSLLSIRYYEKMNFGKR